MRIIVLLLLVLKCEEVGQEEKGDNGEGERSYDGRMMIF